MKFAKNSFDVFYELLELNSQRFGNIDLFDAYKYCEEFTKQHYENFPVASLLLPKVERRFIYSIYSFARFADDIADLTVLQLSNPERISMLEQLEKNLVELKNIEHISNPIFLALKDTIDKKELPLDPFLRLLQAFKMDVNFVQPKTWGDLEYYCSFSANPVGELVLRIFNENNDKTIMFSNYICTGLQLANFWQDLSVDLKRGRVYIPEEFFIKYKIDAQTIFEAQNRNKFELCLRDLVEKTRGYLFDGWKLVWHLKSQRLRYEINATVLGGLRVLSKVEKLGFLVLHKRPKLSIFDFVYVFVNAFF
ncbi:MAG: Squalene synthase [Candidatus Kapaibacterium sp.]|nr:MAG: Squalene synthase [Candidatus Kapabacteria bacterium]